jgi:uncharacterized membrane protein
VKLGPALAAFGLGFACLVGCIAAFGANAPTAVGVVLLIAFLACGVVGLVLGLRATSRFKASTRAAQQQQAQQREPWDD